MNKTNYNDSQAGILRNCFCFDTLEAEFYLDEKNQIIGLRSQHIEKGKIIGEYSNIVLTKGYVSNIVKYIIEDGRYESTSELLKELNIAYNQRINRIISSNPNNLTIYEEEAIAV